MGRPAVDGESPVAERKRTSVILPSSARHEKPGVNLRGPPRKAKYYWTTDSAKVARAKDEKNPY